MFHTCLLVRQNSALYLSPFPSLLLCAAQDLMTSGVSSIECRFPLLISPDNCVEVFTGYAEMQRRLAPEYTAAAAVHERELAQSCIVYLAISPHIVLDRVSRLFCLLSLNELRVFEGV